MTFLIALEAIHGSSTAASVDVGWTKARDVPEPLTLVTLLLGGAITRHVTETSALMTIDAGPSGAWNHARVGGAGHASHSHATVTPRGSARYGAHVSIDGGGGGVDALRSDEALGDHPLGDERRTVLCHVADVLTIVTFGPVGRVLAIPGDMAGPVARVA